MSFACLSQSFSQTSDVTSSNCCFVWAAEIQNRARDSRILVAGNPTTTLAIPLFNSSRLSALPEKTIIVDKLSDPYKTSAQKMCFKCCALYFQVDIERFSTWKIWRNNRTTLENNYRSFTDTGGNIESACLTMMLCGYVVNRKYVTEQVSKSAKFVVVRKFKKIQLFINKETLRVLRRPRAPISCFSSQQMFCCWSVLYG